jgi:hypothetical protein
MIISNGLNEFTNEPEQDEDISSLLLSTDKSVKNTNAYISSYIVVNKSTQVSLNKSLTFDSIPFCVYNFASEYFKDSKNILYLYIIKNFKISNLSTTL